MPMEYALGHLSGIIVKDSAVDAICHGADLGAPGISRIEEGIYICNPLVIYTLNGEAVSRGEAMLSLEDMRIAEKGICIKTKKVIIEPWTYQTGLKSKAKAEVAER